jgi:hypothetical protein
MSAWRKAEASRRSEIQRFHARANAGVSVEPISFYNLFEMSR